MIEILRKTLEAMLKNAEYNAEHSTDYIQKRCHSYEAQAYQNVLDQLRMLGGDKQ